VDFCNSIFRHNIVPPVGTGLCAWWRRQWRAKEIAEAQFPKWLSKSSVTRLCLTDRWQLWEHRIDPLDVLATGSKVRFNTPLWERLLSNSDMGSHGMPIEVRFPYLDSRVVLFGLSLPNMPWTCDKYLLRRLGRRMLPDETISRPKTGLRGDPVAQS